MEDSDSESSPLISVAAVVSILRGRATLLRNQANQQGHSVEVRRRYTHTAEVLGQIANEMERVADV